MRQHCHRLQCALFAKAKAEAGVLLAQRWVLAALRNHTFFSLAELNAAIREKLAVINTRVMKKMGMSRRQLFENIDRPALKPLPNETVRDG